MLSQSAICIVTYSARGMLHGAYDREPDWEDVCLMTSLLEDHRQASENSPVSGIPNINQFETMKAILSNNQSRAPEVLQYHRKLHKRMKRYLILVDKTEEISLQDTRRVNVESGHAGEYAQIVIDLGELIPSDDNVEDEVHLEMSKELIFKLLDSLSEREHRVVHSYFWMNQTVKEISQYEGMAVPTVRKILQRALRKLRQKIRGEKYYSEDIPDS